MMTLDNRNTSIGDNESGKDNNAHSSADWDPASTNKSIIRRNNRGCKSADFYNWPDQPFEEMDTPLGVQQWIQQTIRKDPSNVDQILSLPTSQDAAAWKYEHLRQICLELSGLLNIFKRICSPDCQIMKTAEHLIFLCAFHKEPRECPAADYAAHSVDLASCLLNNTKHFPSRVVIADGSLKKVHSVVRRLHRIFFHGYLDHYDEFEKFENQTHLCRRFVRLVIEENLSANEAILIKFENDRMVKPNKSLMQDIKVALSQATAPPCTTKDASNQDKTNVTSTENNNTQKDKKRVRRKHLDGKSLSADSDSSDEELSSKEKEEKEPTQQHVIVYSTSTLRRNKALSSANKAKKEESNDKIETTTSVSKLVQQINVNAQSENKP